MAPSESVLTGFDCTLNVGCFPFKTGDVTSEIAEDDWPEAVYMRHPRLDHANYELHYNAVLA